MTETARTETGKSDTPNLGDTAAPWGAPEVAPEPGPDSFFEEGRPRLGGLLHPITFDGDQAAVLNAVADTMVPGGAGYPAPSEVDIVDFVGRYLTPSGYRSKHYPFAAEDEFKAGLDRLGQDFVDADADGRRAALAALEQDEDDPLFGQLRAFVYYGYYARPEVTIAIRRNMPAARDYHGPPLPYGYLNCIEPWDEATLDGAGGGTKHLATDEVKRVDLSKVSWLDKKGAQS